MFPSDFRGAPSGTSPDFGGFPMLVDMPSPFDHSFGHVLRQRRDELGLSKAAIADRGGPHPTTLAQLEDNKTGRPRPATFASLDDALEWPRGATARLFHTGQTPQGADTPATEAAGVEQAGGLTITETELSHLILWNTKLARHASSAGDRTALNCAREITDVTSALIGRWVDRAIAEGNEMALNLLTNIVETQPMAPPEHPDYDNQLYRRWRLGIVSDDDIAPVVLHAFRQRHSGDVSDDS